MSCSNTTTTWPMSYLRRLASAFNVGALTVGYTRELGSMGPVRVAAGFNVTAYSIAAALKPFYGSRPVGASVFLRFRLSGGE